MPDSLTSPSRREILAAAAAAGLAPLVAAAATAPATRPTPRILQRSMRWVQLALVEKDPATFDPDWWLEFFKRVHADGACISAGGMCAFAARCRSALATATPYPVARSMPKTAARPKAWASIEPLRSVLPVSTATMRWTGWACPSTASVTRGSHSAPSWATMTAVTM